MGSTTSYQRPRWGEGGGDDYGVPRPIPLFEQVSAVQEGRIWKTTFRIYTGFPVGTKFVVNEYRCADPRTRIYPSDEINGTEIDIWVQCDRPIEPGEITAVITPYE